jgi:hypothetical protein
LRILPHDEANLALATDDSTQLRLYASTREGAPDLVCREETCILREPLTPKLMDTVPGLERGLRSGVCAPVLIGDAVVGVFAVFRAASARVYGAGSGPGPAAGGLRGRRRRGAFTGAQQSKPGEIEIAASGVLFLAEVSEMSPSARTRTSCSIGPARTSRWTKMCPFLVQSRRSQKVPLWRFRRSAACIRTNGARRNTHLRLTHTSDPPRVPVASDFSDTIPRLLFNRARRRLDIDVRNSEAECRTRGVQVARRNVPSVTRST